MLHDQSPSTGLIGSVMTKAISIETALHVSLPAEWPAAPVDVPSFWWSELIAINFTKAANNNFALQRDENTSRLNLPPQTTIKLCGCIRIAEQSILYWSVLTLGGVRHRRLIYQEKKKVNWCNYDLFRCMSQECHHVSSQMKKSEAIHLSNHAERRSSHKTVNFASIRW